MQKKPIRAKWKWRFKEKISEPYVKNSTLESDKSSLHIENQQVCKENDNLTKHVYTLEEQLASLKNETGVK